MTATKLNNPNKLNKLIQLIDIQKFFLTPEGQKLLVLDNISFDMVEDEIIVLLGKSGAGKSTLLRIIAGLMKPSAGSVLYRNETMTRPKRGISMVFQHFALLPWLTVIENVELGLEALGEPPRARREKALKAIDTIGMDGFENAYPKELSGGMKSRVGFARSLVVEPDLLLMDEPFSALDILTSENCRNDLLDLWCMKTTKIKGILCVTHNIEEAILMANRIFIVGGAPSKIQAEIQVPLSFPRDTQQSEFKQLVNHVYSLMTELERERLVKMKAFKHKIKQPDLSLRLPEVSVSELTGFLETMESHRINTKIDLAELALILHLDVDNLFPLTETLGLLKFAKISKGEIILLDSGKLFAKADIQERKRIFAKHLLHFIPHAKHIREVLDKNPEHQVPKAFFLEELSEFLSEEDALKLLRIIIDWGRYAEIFAYDYDTETFSLENPD